MPLLIVPLSLLNRPSPRSLLSYYHHTIGSSFIIDTPSLVGQYEVILPTLNTLVLVKLRNSWVTSPVPMPDKIHGHPFHLHLQPPSPTPALPSTTANNHIAHLPDVQEANDMVHVNSQYLHHQIISDILNGHPMSSMNIINHEGSSSNEPRVTGQYPLMCPPQLLVTWPTQLHPPMPAASTAAYLIDSHSSWCDSHIICTFSVCCSKAMNTFSRLQTFSNILS
ncbi:hypothetical protein CPB84DRAFT_1744178 [Gymnopilus junonius]|uniref:Uncharacterized protein n=1 Tax=Gymnopilus junonius TaxID=109634 RepID=A0A9P5TS22_GYMJU|nr:hypothetical protein CPB84DRAFT_1744178 [Gymnopilus junonius]